MSDKKVGLARSAVNEQAFRLLTGAAVGLYNQVSNMIDMNYFQRIFNRASTDEEREKAIKKLENKITKRSVLSAEEKAKDPEGKVMDAIKEDRERIKLEKNPIFKKEVKEREEKIQTVEQARQQSEKNALELEQKTKQEIQQALEEGKRQGGSELERRLEEKIDSVVSRQLDQATRQDVGNLEAAINRQLQTISGGEYKDREIRQIEFLSQSGVEGKGENIGGLGLTKEQRNELKKIIKKESSNEYAQAFDLIAGDSVNVNNIFDGLVGIGLSMALPIPANIITRLSTLLRNELDIDINKYFDRIDDGKGNEILLINQEKAAEGQVENQMSVDRKAADAASQPTPRRALINSGRFDDAKLNQAYDTASTEKKQMIDEQIKRKRVGRKKKLVNAAQTGAMIGMAVGSNIVGGPIAGVMGLSAGALTGAGAELVSRTELPRIAGEITQKIVDATPRIPTVEGVRRGVRRAITTDRKELRFNVPELGYRTEQETKNILETKATELVSAIQSTNNKELRESLTNQYIAITSQIDMIDEFGLQPYDQDRLTIRQRERRAELPYIRPTTDEEKALVPFDESKERYSKQKSLAIIGSAGAALAAVGAERYRENIPSFFREEPVQLPNDILTEQQDKIEKTQGKGLLRPKFIIPSTNILQPSDQELAADALEFAAFDFVRPNTEGGEGDLQTNILKRSQKLNENIRFQGAGVRVNSLFGYDLPIQPSQETINNLFLYKALPPLKFQEQEYNLSEFEVMSYDPINQRGAIEMFSPYNDFSDTIPDDKNEMDMSILFSIVP